MEGKQAKLLPDSPSLSLSAAFFASSEEWRTTVTNFLPSAASSAAAWPPFLSSHYGLPSSHIILSPSLTTSKAERLQSKSPDSISLTSGGGSRGFLRLPMLRSLEPAPMVTKTPAVPLGVLPSNAVVSIVESSRKRLRPSSASASARSPPPCAHSPPPNQPRLPSSLLSRLRRKKISDRTRIIESLMPWERRMDTATMLEEAHKYVRFLEAQVAALHAMPAAAAFSAAPLSSGRGGALGGLERLNRQQMLQVVVNSPRVQEKLYERGLCVFSVEQVAAPRRHRPPAVSAAVDASE